MFLAPILLIFGVSLGCFALAYAGAYLYRRYKEAQWEASVMEMEAEPATEEEKAIGDEWKSCLDEEPGNCQAMLPEGVEVKFSEEYSPDDEEFFKQAQARAEIAKAEIEKAKLEKALSAPVITTLPRWPDGKVDYSLIPNNKDFVDEDGIRYFFVDRGGSRKKLRSYRAFTDGAPVKERNFALEAAVTAEQARKGVALVGPPNPGPDAERVPGLVHQLVQQILNNTSDLLDFYRKLPAKDLALHIHDANIAGRERVEKIKKRLESDEAAIRRMAEAQVKALREKDFSELENLKPVSEQYADEKPKVEKEVLKVSEKPVVSTYDEILAKVEKDLQEAKAEEVVFKCGTLSGGEMEEVSPDCEAPKPSEKELTSEYAKLSDEEILMHAKACAKALRGRDKYLTVQAVKDKYLTVGEQVGSDDPKLDYYRDPFYFQHQQMLKMNEEASKAKPKRKKAKARRRK